MTVAAIDAVIADVMFMTELDWLLPLDPLAGVPSGTSDFCHDEQGRDQNKDRTEDRPAGKINPITNRETLVPEKVAKTKTDLVIAQVGTLARWGVFFKLIID